MRHLQTLLRAGAAALTLSAAAAQAPTFFNFEVPVTKGIVTATATVGSTTATYVVACNADDDALLVLNTATMATQRVPVGSRPVSLIYQQGTRRLYTANWLGDSVSVVELDPTQTPPARLVTTQLVGDAPADLSIRPGTNELYVLLSSTGELARFDATNVFPLFFAGLGSYRIPIFNSAISRVMKHPVRILHTPSGDVRILNKFAGTNLTNIVMPSDTDFDLALWNYTGAIVSVEHDLGTSNMGMSMASSGDLFVVGNNARNDLIGEPTLSVHAQGFVESKLHVVSPAGVVTGKRDLNTEADGTVASLDSGTASLPTDVVLLEGANGVERVFTTCMQTDNVIELDLRGAANGVLDAIRSVHTIQPRAGYTIAGPRSLTIASVGGQTRLYVLCRFDFSIKVFAVNSTGLTPLPAAGTNLQDAHIPAIQKVGRKLLYSAAFSGTGKVACASCHIDGGTDGLAWRLDDLANTVAPPISGQLMDGIPANTTFQPVRDPMVTQSLLGLRTHGADTTADVHPFLSTEPFYWRGARIDFAAFAPAFINLMGRSTVPDPVDMQLFRDFTFTMMYPPNPEQPLTRQFGGDIGQSASLTDGSGALRGMKLFHNMPLNPPSPLTPTSIQLGDMALGRSCVQCHALPAGTNGRLTLRQANLANLPNIVLDPRETPQIRGLRSREALHRPYTPWPATTTSYPPSLPPILGPILFNMPHGLLHNGVGSSIDDFIANGFNPLHPDLMNPSGVDTRDVVVFVRQLDSGVAPMVGMPLSLTSANLAGWAMYRPWVSQAEVQVERGHVGLFVHRRVGSAVTPLVYDARTRGYVDPAAPNVPTGWQLDTGAQPIVPASLGGGDLVWFQVVPPGEERRAAAANGQLAVQTNTAPSGITVRLIAPDPWQQVSSLAGNFGTSFWRGPAADFPASVNAFDRFFQALAAVGTLGVSGTIHHEPPRRLSVAGTNIQPGATLTVRLPYPSGVRSVTLDLNPVRDGAGQIRWETNATLAPLVQYALLCGWFAAPSVQTTWNTGVDAGLAPATFNSSVQFTVNNEHPAGPQSSPLASGLAIQ